MTDQELLTPWIAKDTDEPNYEWVIDQWEGKFYISNTCHGCASTISTNDIIRLRDMLNALNLQPQPDTEEEES